MAPSTDSGSADPVSSSVSSARLVQSFPCHDTIKLEEGSFVQWQQHIRLIIEGYELQGFLEGTLAAPPQFVASPEDIQTQEILLRSRVRDGLYQFLVGSSVVPDPSPSVNNTGLQIVE
ncbi:uncharacterized protein [Gossypium hirsutum]|uniref:Retrotransposon Copia-like N-terminal domain-containing protein n=1 Tax=Gossypium hirsutum TaxID=3635 RepID=A0ABM2ZU48_GOSHI|nr:uncharacterized protein LOC121215512 [Gossypium hirsutum]